MSLNKDFLEIERLTVTVITDNYYDALRPDPPNGKRYRSFPGASIHAEHGFSCHLETVVNGRSYFFMFDYGIDSSGIINNMRLLNVDSSKFDALGLSHGDFDHWGGLMGVLEHISDKTAKELPIYMGDDVFARRYSIRPGSPDLIDLGELKREEIEDARRFKVIVVTEPEEVVRGCYLTGKIERVTGYEQVPDTLLVEREGRIEQDYFYGEQAIVCAVKDKGIVILSGCAHVGLVNTVKYAQKITGINKVHAVIGGFHLINAKEEIIEKTISDIKTIAPDYIIPAHCTGFEAITRFAKEMPEQFILNTAGTKYVFGS
ncbi:MAG: MBL fold metallo-hydrolase [Proteobacteria bacterium]|nr:MBL fold metallo-hydrolase [Pseudomonadota bacterium]